MPREHISRTDMTKSTGFCMSTADKAQVGVFFPEERPGVANTHIHTHALLCLCDAVYQDTGRTQ